MSVVHPELSGVTGLTGALDRSAWCKPLVGLSLGNYCVRVVLSRGPTGQFLACLELFC
jgi:hypothetical protein